MTGEKPESSKRPKKATKKSADDKKTETDATPETAKAEKKTKAKKSKADKDAAEHESSTIAPHVAVDERPLETPSKSEKEHIPATTEKQSAPGIQTVKPGKGAKDPAKEPKASKIESAKRSTADAAVNVANIAKKGAKTTVEKAKEAADSKTSATVTATKVADVTKKEAKAGTGKAKQAAKSTAPILEASAAVADAVKKDAKIGAAKAKKGVKSKDEPIKPTEFNEEQIPETSKSRKRKALASADAEVVKTEILDPLTEHASAKKKQKKENIKSKSIGDAVGELLATATEGANAARASLGGLATSIMGGASEAAGGVVGAKKSVKASAKKAKGEGKAIAEDVAESFGKIAANEGPEQANLEDDSNDEPDDHTTALLAGFESDGDEDSVPGSGFQQGQKIPPLPQAETIVKKLEDAKNGDEEGPGVVYVGRIPHGFFEHEMREYFSQFGDISRLRLSRSRKSGTSKHYAFVEFSSAGVAKIVADTMDNYLMFGHILKCKIVLQEQVHESLWKGANKRFKAVPWNKIEGRKLEMGLGREQWAERIEGEKKRRASKNEKTKEIGYKFETGELKGVSQVPVRGVAKKIEDGEKIEEEKSLVTAASRPDGVEEGSGAVVVVSEEVKTKRVKKVKGKIEETITTGATKTKRALDIGEETVGSAAKKVKKGKNTVA